MALAHRACDKRYCEIGNKHRALSRYYMILNRLKTTERSKSRNYKGVKMLISKDEFVKWFMENDFKGASVDRINSKGDYTIDNIQLIPLSENIRKDKVKEKDGYCECYDCKKVKKIEEFVKDNRRKNGHSTICKECERKRGREKYKRLNKLNQRM